MRMLDISLSFGHSLALALGLATMATLGCGSFFDGSDTRPPDDNGPTSGTRLSGCGGFAASGEPLLETGTPTNPGAYCDAEVLHWSYDATAERLEVTDARISLNCCGDQSVSLTEVEGVWVLREQDAIPADGSRCRCMCVYDFSATSEPIASQQLPFRIERSVEEPGVGFVTQVIWEGELDLTAGSGAVILDTSPTMDCDSSLGRTSDCGGLDLNGQEVLRTATTPYNGEYCDAEVLHWAHDPASALLELTDARVMLNCCGEHLSFIELVDGVWVMTEIDNMLPVGARCLCTCAYDFSVQAAGVATTTVTVRIVRMVEDDNGYNVNQIWQGDLDLSLGTGWLILDDSPAPMCPGN